MGLRSEAPVARRDGLKPKDTERRLGNARPGPARPGLLRPGAAANIKSAGAVDHDKPCLGGGGVPPRSMRMLRTADVSLGPPAGREAGSAQGGPPREPTPPEDPAAGLDDPLSIAVAHYLAGPPQQPELSDLLGNRVLPTSPRLYRVVLWGVKKLQLSQLSEEEFKVFMRGLIRVQEAQAERLRELIATLTADQVACLEDGLRLCGEGLRLLLETAAEHGLPRLMKGCQKLQTLKRDPNASPD